MVINYIKIVGASILLSKWEYILSIEFEYKGKRVLCSLNLKDF